MFQLINDILHEFRNDFKRESTWQWFVVLIMGFIVRNSTRGVTTVISALKLNPSLYHTMLHFFRSAGYAVSDLYAKWIQVVLRRAQIVRIANRVLLLGDHLKMPKEGRRMPGVRIMHQESQNSGKGEYIEGHLIAHVSAVATNGKVHRSLPLMSERQAAPPRIEGTKKPDGDTIVTQMVNLGVQAAKSMPGERAIIALDAYFAKASAFEAAAYALDDAGKRILTIVTRASRDTVGFMVPVLKEKRGPGQPRKYGDKIGLYGLFSDMSKFETATMMLYGKSTQVKYLCADLIWKPTKGLIRFVAVELNGSAKQRVVLMCDDPTLTPQEIIAAYGLRFKIEPGFNELKNDMGAFSYRFWTLALPKRKKWKKKNQEPPCDTKSEPQIKDANRAIESHICLSTIATGILTIMAFTHNRKIWKRYPGWIKTRRTSIPSTAIIKETLAQDFPVFMQHNPDLPICSIVNSKLRQVEFIYDDVA